MLRGSVHDSCGACFDQYIVEWVPANGGEFQPVDPERPVYEDIVINGIVAEWNTTALGLENGPYLLRITAWDDCGNSAEQVIEVFINSDACCSADVDENGVVDFQDLVKLLANWGPCP